MKEKLFKKGIARRLFQCVMWVGCVLLVLLNVIYYQAEALPSLQCILLI